MTRELFLAIYCTITIPPLMYFFFYMLRNHTNGHTKQEDEDLIKGLCAFTFIISVVIFIIGYCWWVVFPSSNIK